MEPTAVLTAADRNLATTLVHFARTGRDAAFELDDGVALVSISPTWPGPYQNAAFRLDPDLPPADVLGRAERFFARRCPGFCVWIAAHADVDLESQAVDAGYAAITDTSVPRMVLDHPIAAADPPPGVELHEVVDDAGRLDFVAVTIEAYAESFFPAEVVESQLASVAALRGAKARAVVARRHGRAEAAAAVFASDGVASIQLVGTVPEARRLGLAELCTRWTVGAGFELGAEAVVLEASEQGEPVYRRMGFEERSRYRWCFGPPPPPDDVNR